MSLWSTLPPDEQLLIEPADEADLALAGEQDERADLAAYRRSRRRARTRRLGTGALGLAVLVLLWQLIAMLIIIMIAILGLVLDAGLRGLLLLAGPSRRR
jgi:hypothetical protein